MSGVTTIACAMVTSNSDASEGSGHETADWSEYSGPFSAPTQRVTLMRVIDEAGNASDVFETSRRELAG